MTTNTLRATALALTLALLAGCSGQWRNECQGLGLQPGTSDFAQCMLMKEAMFVDTMNQISATTNAVSNSLPQRVNVHVYRH